MRCSPRRWPRTCSASWASQGSSPSALSCPSSSSDSPGLVTSIVAGYLVVPIVARFAPRIVVPAALLLNAFGMGIVAFTPEHTVTGMLIAFLILGIGLGAAEVVTNDLILAAVPANRAG